MMKKEKNARLKKKNANKGNNMQGNNVVYTNSGIPIKISKKMGLGYIIASLFFFFNPDINIIDIFPDVFGYMLLCAGLSKLSFINSEFEEAAARFKKMIFVSLGKLVAFITLFGVFNESERTFGFLLFTFSFMVLDLIFLLPATKSMFEGFVQLTRKYKSHVAYDKEDCSETDKKSYIEKIYRFTMVFFVLKAVLRTLPEFIALTISEYTENSFIMYMYEFINVYRMLGAIVVLAVGIVWLRRSYKFFVRLSRETDFVQNMREEFAEKIKTREGVFIKKAIKTALILFGLGALLSVDFHIAIDLETVSVPILSIYEITINLIPDFMSALCFLVSALMLRHYVKFNKRLVLVSSIYMAISLIASALKVYFAVTYGSYSAVNYVSSAFSLFYVICTSTIIENIAFVAMIVAFYMFMKELIYTYTGYIPSRIDNTTEQLIDSAHKELSNQFFVVIIFAVISAITASIFDFMLIERTLFAQTFWVIDLVSQLAFACIVFRALFGVKDEVESRYMLS